MNDYCNKAMDKIRDELAAHPNQPAIAVLGEYITARLQCDPGLAPRILDGKKSLTGALDAIRGEAKKRQHGGVAVVSDAEGFAIVDQYFGITPGAPAKPQALAPARNDLDLDALLEV